MEFAQSFKANIKTMVEGLQSETVTVAIEKDGDLFRMWDKEMFYFVVPVDATKGEENFTAYIKLGDLQSVAKEIKKNTTLQITTEGSHAIFEISEGAVFEVESIEEEFGRPLEDIFQYQEVLNIPLDVVEEFKDYLTKAYHIIKGDYSSFTRVLFLEIHKEWMLAKVFNGEYIVERKFKCNYNGPKEKSRFYLERSRIPLIIEMLKGATTGLALHFNESVPKKTYEKTYWVFGYGCANVRLKEPLADTPVLNDIEKGIKYRKSLEVNLESFKKVLKKESKDKTMFVDIGENIARFYNAKGFKKLVEFQGKAEGIDAHFEEPMLFKVLDVLKGDKLTLNFYEIEGKQSRTVKIFVDEKFAGYIAMRIM